MFVFFGLYVIIIIITIIILFNVFYFNSCCVFRDFVAAAAAAAVVVVVVVVAGVLFVIAIDINFPEWALCWLMSNEFTFVIECFFLFGVAVAVRQAAPVGNRRIRPPITEHSINSFKNN